MENFKAEKVILRKKDDGEEADPVRKVETLESEDTTDHNIQEDSESSGELNESCTESSLVVADITPEEAVELKAKTGETLDKSESFDNEVNTEEEEKTSTIQGRKVECFITSYNVNTQLGHCNKYLSTVLTLEYASFVPSLLVSFKSLLDFDLNPTETTSTVPGVEPSDVPIQVNPEFYGPSGYCSTLFTEESLHWTTLPRRLVWAIAW